MIVKVKLLTEGDTEFDHRFVDWYLDTDEIKNFFIPIDENIPPCINIFYQGHLVTIKQEKKITEYLNQKFVKEAV